MYGYLKNLEMRLSKEQKKQLQQIYAPTVVGIPLADSRRDLCVLPDGELRSYGRIDVDHQFGAGGQAVYLSSMDGGLSWSSHEAAGRMNACTYIEKGNVYLAVCDSLNNNGVAGEGLFVYRSESGPDDPAPEVISLSDDYYIDSFPPQESAFSQRIWFTAQSHDVPQFFFSDDYGKTWEKRVISSNHAFETVYPHKGLSWCKGCGTEPCVTELAEGRLMMLLRTPTDCFYVSYSEDNGDTWSDAVPSTFYGTTTTACLLRLSDGRVLTFWNNTKPLPQPNVRAGREDEALSPVEAVMVGGHGPNAFTNRDAAHVAISEDGGKTFIGYRELLLNPARNRADFRYVGGVLSSEDKSVHQFQAFELPFNKVLVSAGQNVSSRRLLIFDIDWLYETTRREDFKNGLEDVTVHTYLNSVSGSYIWKVGNGHCAWNRTYSAYPMPDPELEGGEALYVCKHHDPRLLNDIGGVCWNFPAAQKGRVTVELKVMEKEARIILTDRWYNVCDPYAATASPFWFTLDAADVGDGFTSVQIDFDTSAGFATVSVQDRPLFQVRMSNSCPTGLSYLILQCATDGDSDGFYVRSMEKS